VYDDDCNQSVVIYRKHANISAAVEAALGKTTLGHIPLEVHVTGGHPSCWLLLYKYKSKQCCKLRAQSFFKSALVRAGQALAILRCGAA